MYRRISRFIKKKNHRIWIYLKSIISLVRHLFFTLDFPVAYYPELKIIQYLIPKTATSTTTSLLLQKIGTGFDTQNYHTIHAQSHNFFVSKNKLRHLHQDPSVSSFTFVRNPYTRLISCYRDKILKEPNEAILDDYFGIFQKDMKFDAFAMAVCKIPDFWANTHFKSQSSFIIFNNIPRPDFIGRFENYTADINKLSVDFDLPRVTESFNVTAKNKSGYDLSQWYSPELANMVYKRYKKDFQEFGYDKDYNTCTSSS